MPGNSNSRIAGRNAVLEAFRAGRTIDRLYVQNGVREGGIAEILEYARKSGVRVRFVPKERLDAMSAGGKHQGVFAVTAAYAYGSVENMLRNAAAKGEDPFLILLDGIEDPHNLGAILRTANMAGAHGVIIPKNRSVGLTDTVAKVSAGAVNYTPTARVTNLSAAVRTLKERGLWIVCADMDGTPVYERNLTGPVCLVIGSEGKGVSRLVREACDVTVSIPTAGDVGSLNASVAAGVLAFEIVRQRRFLQR